MEKVRQTQPNAGLIRRLRFDMATGKVSLYSYQIDQIKKLKKLKAVKCGIKRLEVKLVRLEHGTDNDGTDVLGAEYKTMVKETSLAFLFRRFPFEEDEISDLEFEE